MNSDLMSLNKGHFISKDWRDDINWNKKHRRRNCYILNSQNKL